MSRGQHQGVTVQAVPPRLTGDPHAGERAGAGLQPAQAVAEAHVAPQGDQLLPDALDHLPQNIGADVGLVGPLHILRSPRLHQGVDDGGNAGVVGAGGELPVREGPSPALAELDVGGWIQQAGVPEALHLGGAAVHILPPLQHHAGKPVPGQKQGGKQARRPHAHHHGHGGGAPLHLRKEIGLGEHQGDILFPGPLHRLFLAGAQGHVHGVNIVDVLLLPGVDRLVHQSEFLQRARAHPQNTGRLFPQLLQISVQRQGDILNSYHISSPVPVYHIFHPVEKSGSRPGRNFLWERGGRGRLRTGRFQAFLKK